MLDQSHYVIQRRRVAFFFPRKTGQWILRTNFRVIMGQVNHQYCFSAGAHLFICGYTGHNTYKNENDNDTKHDECQKRGQEYFKKALH
jgi:hypothetical protein